MKNILLIILVFLSTAASAQFNLKKQFKFATFYGAVNGGTSVSDENVLVFDTKNNIAGIAYLDNFLTIKPKTVFNAIG